MPDWLNGILGSLLIAASTAGALIWRVARLEKDVEKKADTRDVEQLRSEVASKASREAMDHIDGRMDRIEKLLERLIEKGV